MDLTYPYPSLHKDSPRVTNIGMAFGTEFFTVAQVVKSLGVLSL